MKKILLLNLLLFATPVNALTPDQQAELTNTSAAVNSIIGYVCGTLAGVLFGLAEPKHISHLKYILPPIATLGALGVYHARSLMPGGAGGEWGLGITAALAFGLLPRLIAWAALHENPPSEYEYSLSPEPAQTEQDFRRHIANSFWGALAYGTAYSTFCSGSVLVAYVLNKITPYGK